MRMTGSTASGSPGISWVWFDTKTANTVSGNFSNAGLKAGIQGKSVSGDVELADLNGKLELEVVSGNVKIQNAVGEFKVSGMITDTHGRKFMADYDLGLVALHHDGILPGMPENMLAASGISLWSVALEIHTGRIFNFLIGGLYILIVPLAGLTGVTVVTAGYLLWRRKYRNPVRKVCKQ